MGASKYKYRSLTILLFILCCYGSATCQQDKDSIAASFSRYQAQTIQEKLFAHVDKSFYLTGENCWFSIYDVNAGSNMPTGLSSIAYVELLDKELKPILQTKVRLDTGRGHGSFHLPASLSSGHYLFRAYTAWMKNFSPEEYFSQPLTIVNTTAESSLPDSPVAGPPTIRFFPEGGNLVNELGSVVAFKATDHYGHGITCRGTIYDAQQDTLTHFASNRFGMGRFLLKPSHGHTYYARVETSGGVITEKLPDAYDEGYTLHLDDSDPHRLQITVNTGTRTSSHVIYLFVHAHRHISSVQLAYLNNGAAGFTIDKDSLDEGISHLTLFDQNRTPVCERLWCKPPRGRLHIGLDLAADSSAAVRTTVTTTVPASYDTRRRISLNLQTTDPDGTPVAASLSLSAILIDSLQPVPDENILSYLLLSSDLRGQIESPQYYFTNPNAETAEALDNLMLTQGWTRFHWEDVLRNKKPYFEFLPETDGPIINARIAHRLTGQPPPPQICYLSIPGRQFNLATALSHADGSIYFHLDNFYGSKELIAQTNMTDSNYHIDIANPFSEHYAGPLHGGSPLIPSDQTTSLLSRSIAVQAENAYHPAERSRFIAPLVQDTLGFYGVPDRKFNLDDYTRFVTMDEVIREYVDNVRVRRQSGKAFFRVRNALFNVFFDDDPLLLIDGVPAFDADKLIGIDPLKIQEIDVVSHRYYLGPSISDGLVSFRSYDGDLGGYTLDPNAVAIQYNGLEQLREFYSPVYETAAQTQSTIPDLRNQLLWSPAITIDISGKKQLSLYTSDLRGKYVLIVQGITRSGLPGYATLPFTVR